MEDLFFEQLLAGGRELLKPILMLIGLSFEFPTTVFSRMNDFTKLGHFITGEVEVEEAGRSEEEAVVHHQEAAEGDSQHLHSRTSGPYQEGEEAHPCQEEQHQELPYREGKRHIRRILHMQVVHQEAPVVAKEQHQEQHQEHQEH